MQGQNLPGFKDTQLAFSAHIRHPEIHPKPADIEQRRMDIYTGLFYRNIESFLAGAFPIAKRCLEASEDWHPLVREFIHTHASTSPYFLEVSQEFMLFLSQRGLANLPGFMLELCHYEWVELGLDVSVEEMTPLQLAPETKLPSDLALSPVAQLLSYAWPVHEIGPEHQPEQAGEIPTFLVVYRDAQDAVKFLNLNPLSYRMLSLIVEADVNSMVEQLHGELTANGRAMDLETVRAQAEKQLRDFVSRGILVAAHSE